MSIRYAFVGIATGALAYAGIATVSHVVGSTKATISDAVVSPSLAPTVGAKSSAKTGAKYVAPTLAPSLAPTQLQMAPTLAPQTPAITPRVSIAPTLSPSASPTPTPASVTPRPTSAPTPPTPAPSVVPTASPTPTPTASPVLTPTPSPVLAVKVVINEIAWAGTTANASDEWIELYNAGDAAVNLTGWSLHGDADSNGNTRIIVLSGSIEAGAYFLIERTDDTTVSDIVADVFGAFGGSGLRNDPGENLQLRDDSGGIVDRVDCSAGAWFAGSSAGKASMERRDPLVSGNESSNWATNDGTLTSGIDTAGNPIVGTPKYRNSSAPAL